MAFHIGLNMWTSQTAMNFLAIMAHWVDSGMGQMHQLILDFVRYVVYTLPTIPTH